MQMTRSIGCVGIGASDEIISTAAEIQGARPDVVDHAETRQFLVMHSITSAVGRPPAIASKVTGQTRFSRAEPVA